MILPLEQQCAPLALCRRLKELGAPQDSEFAWFDGRLESAWTKRIEDAVARAEIVEERLAAYTVAELGAMLPFYSRIEWQQTQWRATHQDGNPTGVAPTMAGAMAALLIALVEYRAVTFGVRFGPGTLEMRDDEGRIARGPVSGLTYRPKGSTS